MKREAAIDAAGQAIYVRRGPAASGGAARVDAADIVVALEALGVVKLEQDQEEYLPPDIIRVQRFTITEPQATDDGHEWVMMRSVVNVLRRLGYTVRPPGTPSISVSEARKVLEVAGYGVLEPGITGRTTPWADSISAGMQPEIMPAQATTAPPNETGCWVTVASAIWGLRERGWTCSKRELGSLEIQQMVLDLEERGYLVWPPGTTMPLSNTAARKVLREQIVRSVTGLRSYWIVGSCDEARAHARKGIIEEICKQLGV